MAMPSAGRSSSGGRSGRSSARPKPTWRGARGPAGGGGSPARADHDLDELAAENLLAYLEDEREVVGALPTDRRIVVERFRDELGDWRLVLLTPFGGRVHAPWSLALEARLAERLVADVQTIWSDDGIAIRLPDAEVSFDGLEALLFPDPDEVEELVVGQVANSALFASRFRENAARALLLPRRRPGTRTPLWQQRQRAADLLAVASRYGSFPILVETYREVLSDVFDLPRLARGARRCRPTRDRRPRRRDAPGEPVREHASCSTTSPPTCTTATRRWRSGEPARSRSIGSSFASCWGRRSCANCSTPRPWQISS